MYCLNNLCCICFIYHDDLKHLSDIKNDVSYYEKLISSIPEMCFEEMSSERLICNTCSENIEDTYKFRQKCLKSKTIFRDYINQLNSESSVVGEVCVQIADIGNLNLVKEEVIVTPLSQSNDQTNKNVFLNFEEIKIESQEFGDEYQENELIEASTSQENVEHLWENIETSEDCNQDLVTDLREQEEYELRLHGNNTGIYVCDICHKEFSHYSYLKKHRAIHFEDRPFNCEVCNKSFKDASNLNSHKKIHLKFTQDENLTVKESISCTICNATFTSMLEVTLHQNVHTRDNFYTCTICSKKLTSKQGLEKHLRLHTGFRPYSCSVCNKRFNSTSHLNVHMRVHTGEKPYSCKFCDKKFTDSSNFNRHKLRHEQGYYGKSC